MIRDSNDMNATSSVFNIKAQIDLRIDRPADSKAP